MLSRLDQWHFYTKYIRVLNLCGSEDVRADLPTFLLKVLPLIGRQPLLPSLKALVAQGSWLSGSFSVPILAALLSPGVRRLDIRFETYPNISKIHEILATVASTHQT